MNTDLFVINKSAIRCLLGNANRRRRLGCALLTRACMGSGKVSKAVAVDLRTIDSLGKMFGEPYEWTRGPGRGGAVRRFRGCEREESSKL